MNPRPDGQRDAWSLLLLKAQRAHQQAQQQLALAQSREAQLLASEQRVQAMLAEYRRRQTEALDGGQMMADTRNDRQFMAQLQRLLDQSFRATAQARRDREAQAQAVLAARAEVDKAEKLEAHARARERVWRDRVEQKAQDDLATMRFQWRTA
ncbi:MAG: flagellar FliJ family protein [Ramlibacter sp.]|jgi:flagellar export protein FliJ|uniref:flagellar FliJ family protein n=1 Tax=Ramlibacter sp. TaxID=1917967 RepID=UPI0026243291|nr:flagellar FliJ family protein [Ramlibacter sp.]MDH4374856.1 flagellar FliJ family protein [Ramlibacter sp.]